MSRENRSRLSDDARELIALLSHIYLENDRPEKAAMLLNALDIFGQADTKQLTQLALAQLRAGKPESALNTLDRLAMNGRPDAAFHLVRAHTLLALSRADEAGAAMRAYVATRTALVVSAV